MADLFNIKNSRMAITIIMYIYIIVNYNTCDACDKYNNIYADKISKTIVHGMKFRLTDIYQFVKNDEVLIIANFSVQNISHKEQTLYIDWSGEFGTPYGNKVPMYFQFDISIKGYVTKSKYFIMADVIEVYPRGKLVFKYKDKYIIKIVARVEKYLLNTYNSFCYPLFISFSGINDIDKNSWTGPALIPIKAIIRIKPLSQLVDARSLSVP